MQGRSTADRCDNSSRKGLYMRGFKEDVDTHECCGTCAKHKRQVQEHETVWVCDNLGSPFYGDVTQWNDECVVWEARI